MRQNRKAEAANNTPPNSVPASSFPKDGGRRRSADPLGGGKPATKPAVEVGLEVVRKAGEEAGRTYQITAIEAGTGCGIFKDIEDVNDDIREKAIGSNGKLCRASWNRWEVAA